MRGTCHASPSQRNHYPADAKPPFVLGKGKAKIHVSSPFDPCEICSKAALANLMAKRDNRQQEHRDRSPENGIEDIDDEVLAVIEISAKKDCTYSEGKYEEKRNERAKFVCHQRRQSQTNNREPCVTGFCFPEKILLYKVRQNMAISESFSGGISEQVLPCFSYKDYLAPKPTVEGYPLVVRTPFPFQCYSGFLC